VPALYFHSLTATRNHYAGVEGTGRARSINRRKWEEEELLEQLENPRSPATRVLKTCLQHLQLRRQHKAFHPDAKQTVVDLGPELFAVRRERKNEKVLCISNFTDRYVELNNDERLPELNLSRNCSDILTGQRYMGEGKVIALNPYQTVWLLY
jgi:sucrose phosphorylase